ncbi:MAG: aminodeoxychorismate synthase component I [Candidatus Acidulodesulfobacterium ferriphilum]|uniref:Aminodeoxychorismate synthase component I n=1 Tax=Candidatus Acidulodesulfobacterium ferriphilum TaxID=2597223 RepID=A0A519BDM4_9DELT|nr:MAG: aminodeoxychorismate synthase component I [Candidatus Acidulodesulfobacterium ferriphilum]
MASKPDFIERMNFYTRKGIQFLFIIDYEMEFPMVLKLSELNDLCIKYFIDGVKNYDDNVDLIKGNKELNIQKRPISFEVYKKAFNNVIENQKNGNSYLLNLTFKNPVEINFSLEEIFHKSSSRYKLYFKNEENEFVLFSPETFINITAGSIFTYPIKGTIDANIPDAEEILLNDKKEKAEHLTVVDLLRNDLNIVCEGVKVNRFCFTCKVKTNFGELLQMVSEIEGKVKPDLMYRFGDILFNMLPAGSICGAPKRQTLEIIKEAELDKRGYYTGVFGIYDGKNLKSSVMIRFIEKKGDYCFYRSGGGITVYSDAKKEYNEMVEKIYVPIY